MPDEVVNKPWPLVDVNDDGIRPAGKPDECFYCQSKVGQEHGRDCVVVHKDIEMDVVATLPLGKEYKGTWRLEVPYHWDVSNIEFHKNDSSWCASNFLEYRADVKWEDDVDVFELLAPLDVEGESCLCGNLHFTFARVVDDTPKRKIVDRTRTDGNA